MSITGRDVSGGDMTITLDPDTMTWRTVGTAEVSPEAAYDSSLIVQAIKAVLAERTVQVWKGSASDLMAAGEQLLDRPIANSPQQVNKALERFTDRLAEEDGISHKIILVNGGGAKKHLFCYMPEEKAPAMAVADALTNTISN